jgi:hypothetical protein
MTGRFGFFVLAPLLLFFLLRSLAYEVSNFHYMCINRRYFAFWVLFTVAFSPRTTLLDLVVGFSVLVHSAESWEQLWLPVHQGDKVIDLFETD